MCIRDSDESVQRRVPARRRVAVVIVRTAVSWRVRHLDTARRRVASRRVASASGARAPMGRVPLSSAPRWRRPARDVRRTRCDPSSTGSRDPSSSSAVRWRRSRRRRRRSRARSCEDIDGLETCDAARARAASSCRVARAEGSERSSGNRSSRRRWIGCVCARRAKGRGCKSA